MTASLVLVVMQGCKATICMPLAAPSIKVAAVQRLGGEVQLVGQSYSETETFAQVCVILAAVLFQQVAVHSMQSAGGLGL